MMHSITTPIRPAMSALLYCGIIALTSAAPLAGEPVTIESLLREMVDRDSVARFPEHDFRLKQASSYNRESKTPAPPSNTPTGWFANQDFNTNETQTNLVRIEENDDVQLGASISRWEWDDSSMYFPSIFGTGTEDYYAYSWGGRSTDFYEHPFHNQVRSNRYDKLNRKADADERDSQGYSTEGRTRALDTMPFGSSLKLDMEVWAKAARDMGYGVGVYWYGDADTTSNRKPDPESALLIPQR